MASHWRVYCPPCRWIGFADEREDVVRMVKEHIAGAAKQPHAVAVGPGPRREG